MPMKTVSIGALKSQCLKIMEDVRTKREPILITRKGRPVAKLVPADEPGDVFGCLSDFIEIIGDIESPAIPLEDWESLR
jgi:prevent-host-death family protein